MSLHLYRKKATDFIHLWTCTYSQIILTSIITTGNIPSFSASVVTFFLSFMKTNNVYGYIMNPVMTEELYGHNFSRRAATTVLRQKNQYILHSNHSLPTYMQNYFRNIHPQKLRTYIRSIQHKCYVLVLHFLHS